MEYGHKMLFAGRIYYSFASFRVMSFEEYLSSKKIDSVAFKAAEPQRWEEWRMIFEEVSPASFTAQKLYLINPVRRKYLLKETAVASQPSPPSETSATPAEPVQPKPAAKPVFKPKIK